jgi:SAM-dependent methyltransferase
VSIFDSAHYGEHAAPFYDQLYPTVEAGLQTTLLDLAGSGPVLDLGIGTGRAAIPLRRAGVQVHGIDASPAMIAALRARAGAQEIPVILGDFSAAPLGGDYQLIYSLVSTFFLLTSLELQRACFGNIARHLRPGGRFVSETFSTTSSYPLPDSHTIPVATPSGVQVYRVSLLSTPLVVLDALARESGLRLTDRWSNWFRDPYESTGSRHVSVYALEERHAILPVP